MKQTLFLLVILLGISCGDDDTASMILSAYIAENDDLELDDLIACAAGKTGGLSGMADTPVDVFFYPIEGATDFRYFEATSVADSMDFSKYEIKDLEDQAVFNGYLWKFNNTDFDNERMGVVTYKTPGKLHVCTPIRLKHNPKPTEVNDALLEVTDNGITPSFSWQDGIIDENVIYFQMISDAESNLISGTYTIEKNFTFYNLSNVVLNITDENSTPTLQSNTAYKFSLMAVSEDNWVNLFIEQSFTTQ